MSTAHTYSRDVFSAHAESLSKLSARMVRGSEVLELGPASGYFTRILKEALQCKVDAIEIDANMAQKAKPYCRDLHVADLDTLDWNALWPARRYDAIIAADVLEHLRFPERALQALLRRLKPEGKLLISLPNIAYAGMIFGLLEDDFRYRAEGLLDHTHLRFFTRTTLEEVLSKAGWGVTWRGEVGKDLYEAEFHTRLETWPPAVRDFVCNHPNRRAYQLLCECVPQVRLKTGMPTVDAAAAGPPQFAARLMWAAQPEAISFERGATVFGEIGSDAQVLQWKLPEAATYVRIRLADRPGYMHLHKLVVQTGVGTAQDIALAQCELSPDAMQSDGALLFSNDEPWLALPTGQYPAGTTIAVHCGWPMSGDYEKAGRALNALRAAQDRHVQLLSSDIAQATARADTFEKNMLAHEAIISERDTQLVERARHVAHLETLITERERIIIERDGQLSAVNSRASDAEQALNALRTESEISANALQAHLHALEAQNAHLKTLRGWVRTKLSS